MKHESRPYNTNLERKLEQLPGVDADHLWDDMHLILDKKMPEKREKRRFIVWFLNDRGLFTLGVTLLITAAGLALFYLSPNRTSSTNTTNKLSASVPLNKANETNVNSDNKNQTSSTTITNATKNKLGESSSHISTNERIDNNISQQNKKWNNPTVTSTNSIIINSNTNTNTSTAKTESKLADNIVGVNQTNEQSTRESNHAVILSVNQQVSSEGFKSISQDLTNTELEKSSSQLQQATAQTNAPKKNIRVQKEKGLYAGIVAGIDLSSVHFQSMGTGGSQGLILGYALNNRWSIESGVLWDKKRYYDDGTYFNPPGYTPSPSVQIVSVNGTNKNYELPINVRYTIIPRKNSLFATAGLSSYLMKSEHFEYEYVQSSQPGGHNYFSYNNATKNWFSVANLSLGYSHKLGSVGSLRIEPYLKIPIKNLGTANMPIMSTGLNIGFTRSLSR